MHNDSYASTCMYFDLLNSVSCNRILLHCGIIYVNDRSTSTTDYKCTEHPIMNGVTLYVFSHLRHTSYFCHS